MQCYRKNHEKNKNSFTHATGSRRIKPTHKLAGKENKHAGVEGQVRKAASFRQKPFIYPAHVVNVVDVLSGSRRIFSPCVNMTAETRCPKSSVCLFQINLPSGSFSFSFEVVDFFIKTVWKLNGWIFNITRVLDIPIYYAISWYEDFPMKHEYFISARCSSLFHL